MPIIFNNQSYNKKQSNAKFFSTELTGSGKSTGVLCTASNPVYRNEDKSYSRIPIKKGRYYHESNSNIEVTDIPVHPIPTDIYNKIPVMKMLQEKDKMLNAVINGKNIYIQMLPYSVSIISNKDDKKKQYIFQYAVTLFIKNDNYDEKFKRAELHLKCQANTLLNSSYNVFCSTITDCPKKALKEYADYCGIDNNTIDTFINQYDLYTNVLDCVGIWEDNIDNVFEIVISDNQSDKITKAKNVAKMLMYLEQYNVKIELYKNIYNSIIKYEPDLISVCTKCNLNIMLNDLLQSLNNIKSSLPVPNVANNNATLLNKKYSNKQWEAITSNSPLNIIQAGAGTGKSTTILGRIDYLTKNGINDVTVISFTNAAADNIKEKNPNVTSVTIASMIHNIYTMNYTNHELSAIESIINSIDIYCKDDNKAYELKEILRHVLKNERTAFTELNNFVEENFDEVMNILNTIEQTTLELEIIICYQGIDKLRVPDDYLNNRYLMIDEVQDNSLFEVIYVLKYINKFKKK